ncbi:MAG: aminopeptidase N, partial [Aquamicrobium sp.]|nr:aminopeptidase N [Aquamicrobium sp.]
MRKDTGQVFRIEDYRPCDYTIPRTRLTFVLDARETLVTAEFEVERRQGVPPGTPLVLDGDELELVSLSIDGRLADAAAFTAGPQGLTISRPPRAGTFRLTVVTRLEPARNGTLMGLYRSNGVWCTQCEPEGFRRITYFLDRPDMLSVYTVRIEASRKDAPLLLSNGNPVEGGQLSAGRHYAVWHDPFPKPSYLFALVAGDLAVVEDAFVTASGRKVALAIHVEHGKEARAAYAMDALKRSMR